MRKHISVCDIVGSEVGVLARSKSAPALDFLSGHMACRAYSRPHLTEHIESMFDNFGYTSDASSVLRRAAGLKPVVSESHGNGPSEKHDSRTHDSRTLELELEREL
jgi:hypothetical protein